MTLKVVETPEQEKAREAMATEMAALTGKIVEATIEMLRDGITDLDKRGIFDAYGETSIGKVKMSVTAMNVIAGDLLASMSEAMYQPDAPRAAKVSGLLENVSQATKIAMKKFEVTPSELAGIMLKDRLKS